MFSQGDIWNQIRLALPIQDISNMSGLPPILGVFKYYSYLGYMLFIQVYSQIFPHKGVCFDGFHAVTSLTKHQKNESAESIAWMTSLAQSIDLIGTEHFTNSLIRTVKVIANIDYAQAYAFYQNERPACLFHTFSPEKRVIYVDDYIKGPYLLDPFFKACTRKIDTGLYRIRDIAPDRFYQSEYYRSYYNQTGLSDEICYTFYLDKGVAVVISLLRSGDSPRFTAREFRKLSNIVPVIVSLAKRHWHDVPNEFEDNSSAEPQTDNHSQIESKVSDMFGHRLTPRETQVAAQVLEGHSSDAIGKNLGISEGTVRIHRRNIYAKLRISSQQELFSIFFENITSIGGQS